MDDVFTFLLSITFTISFFNGFLFMYTIIAIKMCVYVCVYSFVLFPRIICAEIKTRPYERFKSTANALILLHVAAKRKRYIFMDICQSNFDKQSLFNQPVY